MRLIRLVWGDGVEALVVRVYFLLVLCFLSFKLFVLFVVVYWRIFSIEYGYIRGFLNGHSTRIIV
jgi:hypothetical protein